VVLSNLLQGAGVSGPGLAFLWKLSLKKIGKIPIQNNCSELPDTLKNEYGGGLAGDNGVSANRHGNYLTRITRNSAPADFF
jgi:hypothetical protein